MKKLFTERFAARGIAALLGLSVVMHLLIILGVIPFDAVWGGRLKTRAEMFRFESVSILLNLFMLAVVAVRMRWLRIQFSPTVLTIAFWLMAGLFLLNTVGNLMSVSHIEKLMFTPITAVLSLFCLRLALGGNSTAKL